MKDEGQRREIWRASIYYCSINPYIFRLADIVFIRSGISAYAVNSIQSEP